MERTPFFVNQLYSLGYWLKDYAFYPKEWPLYTYMDHGMTFFDKIPPHEIENDAPLIFKFSPRLVNEYRKVSDKPVYNLLNPTIHCRRKKKIEKLPGARGTLFFPAHSTDLIDDETNWDAFIKNLDNVPDHFRPIDICLHPTDVKKGLDKIFIARGFKVFTAGSPHERKFAENFYHILKNYAFTMSNLLGSYVFYSVEMGIPFSLFGSEPRYFNRADTNIETGEYKSYKDQSAYQQGLSLFKGFHTQITTEQAKFVNTELGVYNTVSRTKAAFLLYKALWQYSIFPKSKRKIRKLVPGLEWLRNKLKYRSFKRSLPQKTDAFALVKKDFLTTGELFRLESSEYLTASVLLGKQVAITDSFWYLHSLKEIFSDEIYRFSAGKPDPYILDCGSNIGLSVIYFKRLYPNARVVAFEPDNHIFSLLKTNLQTFGYTDVQIENKAIWTEQTVLNFSSLGSLGGKLENDDVQNDKIIKVPTVRLKNYLTKRVDFLKMDIEGPEVEVLADCSDQLSYVENLFVEYHSDPAKPQQLHCLLSILNKAGFRVYIKEAWNNLPLPFMRKQYQPFYDLQLNIFAYR